MRPPCALRSLILLPRRARGCALATRRALDRPRQEARAKPSAGSSAASSARAKASRNRTPTSRRHPPHHPPAGGGGPDATTRSSQWMVARYGNFIRLARRSTRMTLLLWSVPVLAPAVGLARRCWRAGARARTPGAAQRGREGPARRAARVGPRSSRNRCCGASSCSCPRPRWRRSLLVRPRARGARTAGRRLPSIAPSSPSSPATGRRTASARRSTRLAVREVERRLLAADAEPDAEPPLRARRAIRPAGRGAGGDPAGRRSRSICRPATRACRSAFGAAAGRRAGRASADGPADRRAAPEARDARPEIRAGARGLLAARPRRGGERRFRCGRERLARRTRRPVRSGARRGDRRGGDPRGRAGGCRRRPISSARRSPRRRRTRRGGRSPSSGWPKPSSLSLAGIPQPPLIGPMSEQETKAEPAEAGAEAGAAKPATAKTPRSRRAAGPRADALRRLAVQGPGDRLLALLVRPRARMVAARDGGGSGLRRIGKRVLGMGLRRFGRLSIAERFAAPEELAAIGLPAPPLAREGGPVRFLLIDPIAGPFRTARLERALPGVGLSFAFPAFANRAGAHFLLCVPAGRRGCGRAARMPAPARRAGTRDAPAGGSALQRGAARLPGARPAAAARAGDASHRRRGEGEGRRDRRRRRDRSCWQEGWLLRPRLAARL